MNNLNSLIIEGKVSSVSTIAEKTVITIVSEHCRKNADGTVTTEKSFFMILNCEKIIQNCQTGKEIRVVGRLAQDKDLNSLCIISEYTEIRN